jgi:hypothetical protein
MSFPILLVACIMAYFLCTSGAIIMTEHPESGSVGAFLFLFGIVFLFVGTMIYNGGFPI